MVVVVVVNLWKPSFGTMQTDVEIPPVMLPTHEVTDLCAEDPPSDGCQPVGHHDGVSVFAWKR